MDQCGMAVTDEELAAIIKNADDNNDGKISFEGKSVHAKLGKATKGKYF